MNHPPFLYLLVILSFLPLSERSLDGIGNQYTGEKDAVSDAQIDCDVDLLDDVELYVEEGLRLYNGSPSNVLRCIPSNQASEITLLNNILRLDALKKVSMGEEIWYKVETFASPKREGWIKESDLTNDYIHFGSWTTFVLRIVPAASVYYSDEAVLYELRGGAAEDSLSIPVVHGVNTSISLVHGYQLHGVNPLIRYETRRDDDTTKYYQDLIAYANGTFTPLVYTDKSIDGDTAIQTEYVIYLPDYTSRGEVFLAPLLEGHSPLSAAERYEDRYRFTGEVSVPIDQCIIRFCEQSTHVGKLKRRITEVYHWNGTDVARMYGDEIDFGK